MCVCTVPKMDVKRVSRLLAVKDPRVSFVKSRRVIIVILNKLQKSALTNLSDKPIQTVHERVELKTPPGQLHKNVGIIVAVKGLFVFHALHDL